MVHAIGRRAMMVGGLSSVALAASWSDAAFADSAALSPIALPPPIGQSERLARLATARTLMQRHGIGAILVEAGPSLDYFTGVEW